MNPRTKRIIKRRALRLKRWAVRHPVKAFIVTFLAIGLFASATTGFKSPSTPPPGPVATVVAQKQPAPMLAPHSKAAKPHAPRVGRALYATYRIVRITRRLFR